MPDSLGLIIGLLLTLSVYSYIFGDNAFYRLAIHILVGVSAAYAAVVVFREVIWQAIIRLPQASLPLGLALAVVPLLLGLLLLIPRYKPTATKLSNAAAAVLVGIGAAVALMGSLLGTLWPQLQAAGRELRPELGLVSAVLTVCTLLYFQFMVRPTVEDNPQPTFGQRMLGGGIGRAVLMLTFGALFATALTTSLTLLTAHISQYLALLN